ncbi:MAG: NYN domain-containing protein [Pirellulales bacterium]|nr:NYN domain-containing protein [Pirellulales bacterium]
MPLIIDAYNLIHAANILGRGVGPGGLERARAALLNFLIESLPDKDKADCAVVFDSGDDAPPGLPNQYEHEGLMVYFSRGYENADALIEELIVQHSTPRQLTVVSSDHRVQNAARRRRARAVDADVWHAEVITIRKQRSEISEEQKAVKPIPKQTKEDVEYWTEVFEEGGKRKDEG